MFTDDEKKLLLSAISGGYKIFGFKIQELVIIGSLVVTIIAFYVRTDNAMNRLIKVSDYLVEFAKNSDNYHSSVTRQQFNQGKPDNGVYRSVYRKDEAIDER